jgi:hypothetical protein
VGAGDWHRTVPGPVKGYGTVAAEAWLCSRFCQTHLVCELLGGSITVVRTARRWASKFIFALGTTQANQNCMHEEIKSRTPVTPASIRRRMFLSHRSLSIECKD